MFDQDFNKKFTKGPNVKRGIFFLNIGYVCNSSLSMRPQTFSTVFYSRALIFWTQTKASAYQQDFEFYQKMLCLTNTMLGLQFWGQGRFHHNPELCCGLLIFLLVFLLFVLGSVVFRFPNNLEKHLNKFFMKSSLWWNLHWCFIMEQEVYWF